VLRPGEGFLLDGRQTLPWDYFLLARYSGAIAQASVVGDISGFEVSEISVVDGVDFSHAE
jgi:hypothetical protein